MRTTSASQNWSNVSLAVDPFKCYRDKAKAGRVSQRSLDEMEQLRDLMQGAGNSADAVAQAQRVLEQMKRKARQRRIETGLQFKAYQRAIDLMESVKDPRLSVGRRNVAGAAAAESMLVRDHRGVHVGTANVQSRSDAIRGQSHSLFIEGMEALRRKGLGVIDSEDQQALQLDILRALYGDTGVSAQAKSIADAWVRVDNYLIAEARRGGADIVQRRDWRIPQRHDGRSFRQAAGKNNRNYDDHLAAWKADITPRLDRDQMLSRATGEKLTDAELEELLDDMFDSVYFEGLGGQDKAMVGRGGAAGKTRPRKLSARNTMERFIVFRSAKDQMDYNKKFGGDHDLFSIMTGHMDKRSREAAFMQVMGPDPDATMDLMLKRAEAIDGRKATTAVGIFDELSGRLESPDSDSWASAGRAMRNILTAAQLGGAFISAIADISFQALTAHFNGMSFGRVFSSQMRNWIRGAYDTTDTVFAARLGLAAEEWSGSALAAVRVMGEMNGPRVTRKMTDAVMRASLLSSWTQAGRHAFGTEFLGHLADESSKRWADITPNTRRALEIRGMTEAEWDSIRSVPLLVRDPARPQAKYMDVKAMTDAGHREAALKIIQTVQEEIEYAVPSSSPRARANLKGAFSGGTGTRAGTGEGELMRTIGMYKSFPVTLAYTHLSRYMMDPAVGAMRNRTAYMAALVTSTTMMGAMAYNAKAVLAGKNPIDPFDDDIEKSAGFWGAAMLQGGGLGLFGDFLLQDHSRFGKGFALSALGPGFSFADDVVGLGQGAVGTVFGGDTNIGRESVNFVRSYAPGSSLWYARLAFERVMMDQIQAAVDPDAARAFRARANRARRENGQGYFWKPGSAKGIPFTEDFTLGAQTPELQ